MLHLSDITTQVADLAIEVGRFIYHEALNFDKSKIEYKGGNDLVSYVDKEAEKKLVAGLKLILPSAGFVTEEGTEQMSTTELNWVVDPLDGTTNFLHGLPVYSISIGLMDKNEVVVGVVYEINRGECFTAYRGGGAFCNAKQIQISTVSTLKESLIATGFPYSLLDKGDQYFKLMQELQISSHGLRRLGSAAVDLCYVAAGRFDAYYEFNLNPWDVSAGILIVEEAGGVVTDFYGEKKALSGKQVLAAGKIHLQLLTIIKKHWS